MRRWTTMTLTATLMAVVAGVSSAPAQAGYDDFPTTEIMGADQELGEWVVYSQRGLDAALTAPELTEIRLDGRYGTIFELTCNQEGRSWEVPIRAVGNAKVMVHTGRLIAHDESMISATGGTVLAFDSARVRASGDSWVFATDTARVAAYEDSKVRVSKKARVKALGNSDVTAFDSAIVVAFDFTRVNASGSAILILQSANVHYAASDNVKIVNRSDSEGVSEVKPTPTEASKKRSSADELKPATASKRPKTFGNSHIEIRYESDIEIVDK